MAVPAGKTPISYLQELCTKRGITPQYDLLASEGAVHEPNFIMKVTVGEIVANGKAGSSKKKAKHSAAQAALNQILGISNGTTGSGDATSTPVQPQEGEGPGNPVGQLQELTQKKLMKPPIYEFNTEQGPPHAREFICIVKLGKIQEKGNARSKKAAKRVAAQAMLTHIKGLVDENNGESAQLEEEDEDIPLKNTQQDWVTLMKAHNGRFLGNSVNGLKAICIKTGFHPRICIISVDNCYLKNTSKVMLYV